MMAKRIGKGHSRLSISEILSMSETQLRMLELGRATWTDKLKRDFEKALK